MKKSVCTMILVALLSVPSVASAQTPRNLLAAPTAVADGPVTLSDARSFDAPLASEIDDAEIADARREMASAVSAGKFLDGAATIVVAALLLAILF